MKPNYRSYLAFCAPFAIWIILQTFLPNTAWAYAVRTFATGIALWFAKPILRPTTTEISPAGPIPYIVGFLSGLLVLALWVLPEYSHFYRVWLVLPIGTPPPTVTSPSPFAPETCGWTLTIIKLIGSAFIIAPAEEFFFRSFLYRWLQNHDFRSVHYSQFDFSALIWTIFIFTLEHDRPLAAALCALIYGLITLRFSLRAAIVAHITTNLLLAVYVICSQRWDFW